MVGVALLPVGACAEQAEDILLIGSFVRRPPPELTVLPLDAERIGAHVARRRLPEAA